MLDQCINFLLRPCVCIFPLEKLVMTETNLEPFQALRDKFDRRLYMCTCNTEVKWGSVTLISIIRSRILLMQKFVNN